MRGLVDRLYNQNTGIERRQIINSLISAYNKGFNPKEVSDLLNGLKLPAVANPTLLDIEQSFGSHNEDIRPIIPAGSTGNENTE